MPHSSGSTISGDIVFQSFLVQHNNKKTTSPDPAYIAVAPTLESCHLLVAFLVIHPSELH